MGKKIRLIARLDVKDTNLVKGIQLEGLRKLGDPNQFAKEYYEQGIDELLYIDIVASLYNRNNLSDIVRKTVDEVYIPVCVGGGLRSVEDVRHILAMGADKVAINTAAIKRPELITEVAEAFGSQCMVLSIQAKRSRTWPGKWEAYYDNGRAHSGYDVVEWAKRGEALGAGEILLMSVDNEGLQRGMDLELIEAVWLFGLPPEKIQIVVQRQSIVHSAVQFSDNSIIAQLGVPDMRIPIQYALTYPKRVPGVVPELDFAALKLLTFDVADEETFRCLAACKKAIRKGGLAPCAANGANEAAVAHFLRNEIGFLDIGRLVEGIVDSDSFGGDYTLADVYECDRMARAYVEAHI